MSNSKIQIVPNYSKSNPNSLPQFDRVEAGKCQICHLIIWYLSLFKNLVIKNCFHPTGDHPLGEKIKN